LCDWRIGEPAQLDFAIGAARKALRNGASETAGDAAVFGYEQFPGFFYRFGDNRKIKRLYNRAEIRSTP
jgi:hypothetical protein